MVHTFNSHLPAPNSPHSLITGGAGFLGSHICDRLVAEGHEVLCLDNLLSGSLDNIKHLLDHPRFTFIKHDVTQPIYLDSLLPGSKLSTPNSRLDYVLHFASPASPKNYAQYPIHTLKVGALGTHHALGLARARQAIFVLASSSEVYGDPQVNPQPEVYWGHVNPIGPRSVYDEAKRFAEAMAIAYHNVHGLDVRIARIFNTYGPRMRMDDGRALPTFIAQALQGEPLSVYGDGSQTRSFCFIDDLVEGIYRLMLLAPNSQPSRQGCLVVNLGNPSEVTILQLAREVIAATDSSSGTVFHPLPDNDPKVRCPDITRAGALLGWSPQVSRREGLERTIAYFRSQLGLRVS